MRTLNGECEQCAPEKWAAARAFEEAMMACDVRHPTKDLKCDMRKGHLSAHSSLTVDGMRRFEWTDNGPALQAWISNKDGGWVRNPALDGTVPAILDNSFVIPKAALRGGVCHDANPTFPGMCCDLAEGHGKDVQHASTDGMGVRRYWGGGFFQPAEHPAFCGHNFEGWTCQAYKNHDGPHFVKKDARGTMFSWPSNESGLERFKAVYKAASARLDCSSCGMEFMTREERITHENGHFQADRIEANLVKPAVQDLAKRVNDAFYYGDNPFVKVHNADATYKRQPVFDKPLYAWGNPVRQEEAAGCLRMVPVKDAFVLAKQGYASQLRPVLIKGESVFSTYLCTPGLWAELQAGGVTAFSKERVFCDAPWWRAGTLPDLGYDD